MYSHIHVPYLTTVVILAGSVFAQNPQAQPGMPQSGPPGMPGRPTTPSTFPGQDSTTQGPQQAVDPLTVDRNFVKDAAEASNAEIELGKLAEEKGSSEAVKEFGKRMIEDHTKASEQLKQAAAKANIEARSDMSRKDKKSHEKLSKLSGADFDRAYAKLMLSDHKNDIRIFERESQSGNAPALRQFAANTLPTLQEHYKQAQELAANPNKAPETGTAAREKTSRR